MITGPVKSVKAILSGAKTPNAPRPAKQDAETVNKVKQSVGKSPMRTFGPGRSMKGC